MSILRATGRWIGIVALAIVLLVAAYFVALLLWRHWAVSVLSIYVVGATLYGLAAIIAQRGALRTNASYAALAAVAQESMRGRGPVEHWRVLVAVRLGILGGVLAWPANLAKSLLILRHKSGLTPQGAGMHRVLYGDDITLEPWTMLALVAVTALLSARSNQPKIYFVFFAWIAAVYTVCLCLAITIAPGALSQKARRATGFPYLRAVTLAIAAVLLALLSVTIIESSGSPSRSALIQSGQALYSQFDSLKAAARGTPVSSAALLSGLLGALLAAATIQGLSSLKDFRRTDEDLMALANEKMLLGRASGALSAINLVKTQTAGSLMIKAICLAGVDRHDAALEAWRHRALMINGPDKQNDDDERSLLELVGMYPIPEQFALSLLRSWLRNQRSEVSVASLIVSWFASERATAAGLLSVLRANGGDDKNPIITAFLLSSTKSLDEARERLDGAPEQAGGLYLLASTTRFIVSVSGPTSPAEDSALFESWYDKDFQQLAAMGSSLTTFEEVGLAMVAITTMLEFANSFSSPRLEPLKAFFGVMANKFKETAPNGAMIDRMLQSGPAARWMPEPL